MGSRFRGNDGIEKKWNDGEEKIEEEREEKGKTAQGEEMLFFGGCGYGIICLRRGRGLERRRNPRGFFGASGARGTGAT